MIPFDFSCMAEICDLVEVHLPANFEEKTIHWMAVVGTPNIKSKMNSCNLKGYEHYLSAY